MSEPRAFPADLFAGQRYAVVGLGRNGLPAARALLGMGAEVLVWDDTAPARAAAAAEGFPLADPAHGLAGLAALVLSPGIPHTLPAPHPAATAARQAGIPILSDAELLFQAVQRAGARIRFAGITGTNGKSTTTALLAHLLEKAGIPAAAGGNLGTAALALPLLPDGGVYVLEMSSYMLERLASLRFDAAVLLNLSPDHLERHGDMDGYARAKLAIFDRQRRGDCAVFGIDDALTREWAARHAGPAPRLTISGLAEAHVSGAGGMLVDGEGVIARLAEAPALPGAHNAQNAAAATAMALHLGVPRAAIAAGLASFPGLPHRQRQVARVAGIDFIDDSKATNADAASRALGCYDRLIWIAGGQAKAGGISTLAEYFPRIAEALLIGRDAPLLAATLAAHGVPHRLLGTLEAAVPAALQAAQLRAAPVVLLSPACASWDQFANFEARGLRFAELARALDGAPHAAGEAA